MNPDDLLARLEAPLSVRRRLGYLAVGLAGLIGAGLIGTLWATEPALPAHTVAGFALLMLVGLGWAGFAGWALTRRAPLYAADRVLSAWIALGAWLVGGVAVGGIAAARGHFPWGATLVVAALGIIATGNIGYARRRRAMLLARRQELTR